MPEEKGREQHGRHHRIDPPASREARSPADRLKGSLPLTAAPKPAAVPPREPAPVLCRQITSADPDRRRHHAEA
jgi:hypothetical protein